jgi:hypothetical protein
MRSRFFCLGILCLLSCQVQAQIVNTWPSIDAPPKSKVEWVGDDMKIHGAPARIQRFESSASVAEVIAFYQVLWNREKLPSVKSLAGPWSIVGRQAGPYYLTVQSKPVKGGGSTGYLAVSRLTDKVAPAKPSDWYSPPAGAKMVSNVESADPGHKSHHVMYFCELAPETSRSHILDQLTRKGYVPDSMLDDPTRRKTEFAMAFRKPGDEIIVTVNSRGTGSALVLNRIVAD